MKKVLILCLALAFAVSTVVTGTVAFFTDEVSTTNVVVAGNISIEQYELQRAEGVKHNAVLKKGDLVPYEQAQNLFPAFPARDGAYNVEQSEPLTWGPYVTAGDAAADGLWSDEKLVGAMDKMVFIKNTGSSPCYYRTWFAFECPEGMEYSENSDEEFMMNINKDPNLFAWSDEGYAVIGGTRYLIKCATYQQVLESGEISHPSLMQVVMTHNATNEQVQKLDGTYEIFVFTQATQTENFPDAATAFRSTFGDDMPWDEATAIVKTVKARNNEELKDVLTQDVSGMYVTLEGNLSYDVAANTDNAMGGEATDVIVIDGKGHTLTFNQTNGDWNHIIANGDAKLVLKNMHITNSGHNDGPWNRHDINFGCEVELINVTSDKALAFKSGASLKNVKISDANTSDTYAIWIQPNGQTVILDGVTIDMIACSDGRGIKIDEQYLDASEVARVTLNVSNTSFKTEEKSAILVKSIAGADINLKNVDISGVAADSENEVWVDEASVQYADLVTVTGGKKIVEP